MAVVSMMFVMFLPVFFGLFFMLFFVLAGFFPVIFIHVHSLRLQSTAALIVVVATYLDKINRPVAGVVPCAVPRRFFGMAGRHVQIQGWLLNVHRRTLNDDRLRVNNGRQRRIAEGERAIHPPASTRLAMWHWHKATSPASASDLAFDFMDSFLEVQRKNHQADGWMTGFKRQALSVRPAIRQPWL